MTTSRTIPLSSVIINREARQRRELTGIDELAASIAKHGLIQPVVLNENNVLIAGERRYAAHQLLGYDAIEVRYLSDLAEDEQYAIELEENIKREALTWRDECTAIETYHKMKLNLDSKWTGQQTAESLNISPAKVSRVLLIQQEIARGNQLVTEADTFSVAANAATRAVERREASATEDIIALLDPESVADVEFDEIIGDLIAPAPIPATSQEAPLINADFIEWASTYSGPRFNLIHCDFPYGINADSHAQGAAKSMGGYEDGKDVYFRLLDTLIKHGSRFIAESAHLVFWFSMDYYGETISALTAAGWNVNRFPLIWHKSDNSGILPDPARGPRRIYETALMASRGDRKIVQAVANVYPAPVTKEVHMSEKNLDMLKHFFRMFVDDNTVMLDPTCGSANSVRAAVQMGAKSVLGIEKDPEFYAHSKGAFFR